MAIVNSLVCLSPQHEKRLLEANIHLENSIVVRVEHSSDQHSVGGDGYGLSKNITIQLDQLINLSSKSGMLLLIHWKEGIDKVKVVKQAAVLIGNQ